MAVVNGDARSSELRDGGGRRDVEEEVERWEGGMNAGG